MIETYLSTRRVLKGVVVILDIRRTPGQEEFDLLSWLHHYSIAGILVLTKTDKLSKNKQAQKHNLIAQVLETDSDALKTACILIAHLQPLVLILYFLIKRRKIADSIWLENVPVGNGQ
jgi:GTP-binding protein EngB required for normal cell division